LFFLIAPAARAQSPPENSEGDPFSARLTLEHLLEIDPSDPYLAPGMADRDPIEEMEVLVPEKGAPWPRKSTLIFGFGSRLEGSGDEREWTGSPERALLRIDLRCSPAITFGVTGEKDAGERLDLGFLSGYLAARGLPLEGAGIVGDYRVQAGCGLILAGAIAPMGIEQTVRRIDGDTPELAPHRSRDEFNFLRGLAVRFSPAGWMQCLLFSSRRSLSAGGEEDAPSLSTNGLFRTDGEVRRRGKICETIVGGRGTAGGSGDVSCGVTILQAWLSPDLVLSGSGKPADARPLLLGADFFARSGNFRLRGEIARSPGGGLGAVFLGAFSPGGPALVALGLQILSTHFASHRFEGVLTTAASNETSLNLSARYSFSASTRIRGSLCQHWTPSIGPGKTSLLAGWSGCIGGSAGLGRRWDLDWAFRIRRGAEESSVESPEGGTTKRLFFNGRSSARISLHCRIGGRIESLTTAESVQSFAGTSAGEERGDQLRQEIGWKPTTWLGISFTVTMFSADSYAARTTALEDDPISRIRFASLEGEGFRWGCAVTVAPPLSGLTVLSHLSGSDRAQHPESQPVPGVRAWGVRMRWTW
jgi:hypothetical protein